MKNPKKPKVRQMKIMKEYGLTPTEWLVVKNLHDELHVIHRYTNQLKVLPC